MNAKTWQVAWEEFRRNVFRRRFLFALLSLPLFVGGFAIILAITLLIENRSQTIGLVDPANLLENELCSQFRCIASATQAQAALEGGEITAYYLISPSYLQDGGLRLVASEPLSALYQTRLSSALQQRLYEELPPSLQERLEQGARLAIRTPDGTRQLPPGGIFSLLIPVTLLLVFFLAIFSTSGYLMQAITQEKENRTLEILLTSLTPGQMLGGKILGSLGAGLIQVVAWLTLLVLAILVGVTIYGFDRPLALRPEAALVGILSLLLAFITIAAVLAAVGSLVNEATEGQQITGPFSLPFILPLFFLMTLINEPNGALAVTFSLVPFTAPLALTLRLSLATVPAWQVALSLGLQLITALACVWLAGRVFRLSLLRYGKPLELGKILPLTFKRSPQQ